MDKKSNSKVWSPESDDDDDDENDEDDDDGDDDDDDDGDDDDDDDENWKSENQRIIAKVPVTNSAKVLVTNSEGTGH